MAVRDDRSDVKQTTAGFRGPLMVQTLTSAKSKFLSLGKTRQRRTSDSVNVDNVVLLLVTGSSQKGI